MLYPLFLTYIIRTGIVELRVNDHIGDITTGKLNVVSSVYSQVAINSTSTVAADPSEIGFSRTTMHNKLSSAFGIGGDFDRGALLLRWR
jgi:hypothetical protein